MGVSVGDLAMTGWFCWSFAELSETAVVGCRTMGPAGGPKMITFLTVVKDAALVGRWSVVVLPTSAKSSFACTLALDAWQGSLSADQQARLFSEVMLEPDRCVLSPCLLALFHVRSASLRLGRRRRLGFKRRFIFASSRGCSWSDKIVWCGVFRFFEQRGVIILDASLFDAPKIRQVALSS